MKERHRCEIMFIARTIQIVADSAVRFETEEELSRFKSKALDAVIEPVSDLIPKDKERIRKRVHRMEEKTIVPMCKNVRAEKAALISYYLMHTLRESGYLRMSDDSNLRLVMNKILESIDITDEVTQKRMISAKKQARSWISTLQKEGYFV